jgi:CDP-glycerol glycerophosphotransferase (TagB/SpsB family)
MAGSVVRKRISAGMALSESRFGRLLISLLARIGRAVPRDPRLWLLTSGDGGFAGNPKYLFMWLLSHRRDLRPVWLAQDDETSSFLTRLGWPVVRRTSWRGLLLLLRSKVQVFDGTPAIFVSAVGAGAIRVNLWHGVGVKNVESSISVGPTAANYERSEAAARFLARYVEPDLLITSSPLQTRRLARAFQIPEDRCLELGTPRLDVALDPALRTQALRLSDASAMLAGFERHAEVYVYMPTFRDSGRDFFLSAIPDPVGLNRILAERNAFLWLKPHRKTTTALVIPPACKNIGWWDPAVDFYPMLGQFSCLITDYSSILFDYIAVKDRGAVLYTFDWIEYSTNDRDLAINIDQWAVCPRVESFGDLCSLISSGEAVAALAPDGLAKLRAEFWSGDIQMASPRIVAAVSDRARPGNP